MRLLLCCVVLAWPLAAAAQTVTAPGFDSASQVYRCAGGATLQVVTLNIKGGESFAALVFEGRLVLLRGAPAASGARYIAVDEQLGYRWHTKGEEGVLLHLAPDHTARETVVLRDCKLPWAR